MKRLILSAVAAAVLASPAMMFACDGSVKCAACRVKAMPSSLATRSGLFATLVIGLGAVALSRRKTESAQNKFPRD
jgi:hypothetical protein